MLTGGEVGAAGFDGAGVERLKIELTLDCWGAGAAAGAGAGAVLEAIGGGEERRSNAEVVELGGAAGDLVDPMVAPIRSKLFPDEMEVFLVCCGFSAAFEGPESKKPPPLSADEGDVSWGFAGGDLGLVRESKAEKLDFFGAGADGVVVAGNFNPLNASVRPLNASFAVRVCGDCNPDIDPKDVLRSCRGGCCGLA